MTKALDLTNHVFGLLVVLSRAPNIGKETRWLCRCNCGNESIKRTGNLKSGNTKSCGCQERLTHGHSVKGSKSRAYRSWAAMIQRCTNNNNQFWDRYGGRGITVCERWRDFKNFLEDMGDAPMRYSIDRIDNGGNYEPGNCRWADQSTQMRNRDGYKHSPEVRAKMSAALVEAHKRGMKSPKRGKNGQFIHG